MAREMRYVAQPFWRQKRGLVPGEPLPFLCARDAEEGAQILARSAAGAVAYQQVVDVHAEIYDEPEILWASGDLPAGATAVDGEAIEGWAEDAA